MATIVGKMTPLENRTIQVLWETLTNTDVGGGVDVSHMGELSVQSVGTFDSATVTMEGSNDGGTTWNGFGAALTMTDTTVKRIPEHPRLIRPNVTGGGTVDLDVYLIAGPTGG